MTIPGLNVYAERMPHGDVQLVCNKMGVDNLRKMLWGPEFKSQEILFYDSHGEGFYLTIEVKDDESFLAIEPQWSEEVRRG